MSERPALRSPRRPPRRWPNGRFRPARRRRSRCACGEFATHALHVRLHSAATAHRRTRRLVFVTLRLCAACFELENKEIL